MFNASEKIQYSRHFVLPNFGLEKQALLKNASVLVVGAGGLGCPLLQYLTAAGVGSISVIDGDGVELSNLQRQVLFSTDDIGKNKAEAAVSKLRNLNPEIQLESFPFFIAIDNAVELISKHDLIIDGTDNFSTRYLVNDACVIAKKPLVFGSIFKYEGQVSVFNYKNGPTYRCLYPEPPAPGEMPSCSEIGVLGVLPGIIGSLMANEALKILAEIGNVLSGRLLIVDALELQFSELFFNLNEENLNILALSNNEYACEMNVKEISPEEVKSLIKVKANFQFIDVREAWEYDEKNIGAEHISLYDIIHQLDKIDKTKKVVLHCQSGNRSTMAVKLLMENGYEEVYSLSGGLATFLDS